MTSRRSAWVRIRAGSILCASASACSSSPQNNANYVQAAVGLAAAVPAAIVYREVTNECYGNCSYGSECNHDTGLCEPMKERPPAAAYSAAPTFDERCTFAERDWAQNSAQMGEKHPEMQALKRVIEKCFEVRRDPDSGRTSCGTRELDLAELGGNGLGAQHPDVQKAQAALDDCRQGQR
jgi:hypothetical protein